MTDIELNPTSFVDTIQLTIKDTDSAEDEVRSVSWSVGENRAYAVGIEKDTNNAFD